MKRCVVALAAFALTGCSTATATWVNLKKPESDYSADQSQCRFQAPSTFDACMQAKGWQFERTTWTGKSASTFANDDLQCAGGGASDTFLRGPKWRQCLLDRGWTPSTPAR